MANMGPLAAASLDTLFLSNADNVSQQGEWRDTRHGWFVN